MSKADKFWEGGFFMLVFTLLACMFTGIWVLFAAFFGGAC